MLAYDCLANLDQRIHHILCHFHHQQGVNHYLKRHFRKEQIPKRKQVMKQLLQSNDKRTVRRRFATLKKMAAKPGIKQWVKDTEKKLPKLLKAVGSQRIPQTNNAIERFFRAFNRFYKVRCGFFSPISAKRELIFFILMYLFIKQPETAKAPVENPDEDGVEAIMPEATKMPLYQLVNDPIRLLMNTQKISLTMSTFFVIILM